MHAPRWAKTGMRDGNGECTYDLEEVDVTAADGIKIINLNRYYASALSQRADFLKEQVIGRPEERGLPEADRSIGCLVCDDADLKVGASYINSATTQVEAGAFVKFHHLVVGFMGYGHHGHAIKGEA